MKKEHAGHTAGPARALSTEITLTALLLLCAQWVAAPASYAQARADRNFSLGASPDSQSYSQPYSQQYPLAQPAARSQQEIIQQLQSQPAVRAPANTADGVPLPANAQDIHSNAYSAEAVGPTIYSKNVVYPTPYPLPQPIAGRATIGTVSWQYGTQTRPAGFEAALCWNDSKHCVNVTAAGSGSTDTFSGLDATKPFKMLYQVVGTGTLSPPVIGETGQIIVNYRIWQ